MLDSKDKMVEDIASVPKGLRAYWRGKFKKLMQVKWSVMGHREATGLRQRNSTPKKSGKAPKK